MKPDESLTNPNLHFLISLLIKIFIVQKASTVSPQTEATKCPDLCTKEACRLGLLICEKRGLLEIPQNPPKDIKKVIIRNQNFVNFRLSYTNLSRFGPEDLMLQKLVISNCQLISIEPEAFSHLIYLQELDLSNNKLGVILPDTFKSLSLKILVLDGNPDVQLTKDSFRGLVVNSMSIQNCSLRSLDYDAIKQISGYLTTLNLAGNLLQYLSSDFDLLFRRLDFLQLEHNPFNCSCKLKWLAMTLQMRFSRRSKSSFETSDAKSLILPTCSYPTTLRGSAIVNLTPSSFQCQLPRLKQIDLKITSSTSATLSCISDIPSNSRVRWRYKFMKSSVYYRYNDDLVHLHQASISVNKQSDSDFYSCLIVNENGNATVDVKIKWPKTATEFTNQTNNKFSHPIKALTTTNSNDVDDLSKSYLWIKQYTFIEMILATCGTFVITILSFVLLYIIINYRHRNIRSKNALKGYEVGIYSDSQTYDIPQLSPYHESNTGRLLDFKTQQEIKTSW